MALEGNLRDMTLVDLIQVFQMGSKSGVLLLISGADRGVIYVCDGRLIDAVVLREPGRQIIATGEDAVLALLQWQEAAFTFRHDLSVGQRPVRIVHDGEWLVLEAMRRHTIEPLIHQQITAQTQLELAPLPSGAEQGVNLDLGQWRLLSQVSISRDIREICQNTGMGIEQAIRTASELVAIGLISVVEVRPTRPARPARLASQGRHDPALSMVAPGVLPAMSGGAGRGLLGAVMRRISGL